jgi:type IV pilus biogenesis protein CpaD/CtpE
MRSAADSRILQHPFNRSQMISIAYRRGALPAVAAAALVACAARAQQTTAAAPAAAQAAPAPVITVGSVAPDFTLRGATRYGLLATPVRLSDYRGQTVVIAFFYKARTKG